jgi:hypothetical protein
MEDRNINWTENNLRCYVFVHIIFPYRASWMYPRLNIAIEIGKELGQIFLKYVGNSLIEEVRRIEYLTGVVMKTSKFLYVHELHGVISQKQSS